MEHPESLLLAIGSVLLLGVMTDAIGRLTPLPRVTLLLMFGFLVGPSGTDILPVSVEQLFSITASMALTMVGFLLGGRFTLRSIRERGKEIVIVSICVVVVTAIIVFTACKMWGLEIGIALLLAGISSATDPAATIDVVEESKAEGPYTRTLLGVVAIDDAWGLILFSFCSAAAAGFYSVEGFASNLMTAFWEIGGAVGVGVILGLPFAYLSGRIAPGKPTLTEAVGVVFLCGGLAIWLEVSFLIASMVLGVVVVNMAKHHERPFHEIENVEWPFMVLFFVLAGASLDLDALHAIGAIGTVYMVSRTLGRVVGGWVGGWLANSEPTLRNWIGLALLPQAGVALGMALVASARMPELRPILLPVVISSTVLFELTGPVLARYALIRVGEANTANEPQSTAD